jgi:release factor glutamine methyltransferase
MNFDELLTHSNLPRLEARALLEHVSGQRREWLMAHGDEPVDSKLAQDFRFLCERRTCGEPIAYLVGWREFYGRRFRVSPAVLIPRPETELLIDLALQLLPADARVIDLGTGSGCIALTLAGERPDIQVLATDRSLSALAIAQDNARALGTNLAGPARVAFQQSDWWAQVAPELRFEMIVSNPPYIQSGDVHLRQGDLRYEPQMALTDDLDGLAAIRSIVKGAQGRLTRGGHLLLEHGYDQGSSIDEILRNAGFLQVATHFDSAGLARLSQARFI